ncbi:putative metal-binding motif-containing protein [Hyalangium rubrum]|uniref:Metal-binding motif-containing protein n=1 Tax=Hyalangium rubrum TaxID=3103134 RepID=A0ABU5HC45_9BACT|nr:putative metal-binding motif-containing protein [Hyalangium sp. s54d21]MDY7231036.1 putative metal-binding motif-containing protein [Hyalangium sp. s54d21]
MRLFLMGLWVVLLASGCKRAEPQAGALRVELSYATFRPGCLTLKASDKEDPSREKLEELVLGTPPAPSKELLVAVFRQEGWSRNLVLTATAYERSCADTNRRQVDTQTLEAEVPEEGVLPVKMELRAEDLDDDGFVSTAQGGSDCDDDDRQVNPNAPDICNGKDDNCSGDESDATGAITYFRDADGDGYGDRDPLRQPLVSCTRPAGYAANNRDCDDSKANFRPDQAESLCDGQDENCDDVVDDTFGAGTTCTTSQGCGGTVTCQSTTSAACVSPTSPSNWYVDEDGDGRAGTFAAMSCVAPAPGAVTSPSDCNDSSPFAFNGGTERCDRLDNDCNGVVDDPPTCASVSWRTVSNTGSTQWDAVASYAENKAWAVGTNQLAHVEQSTATLYTDCTGSWRSAWARADGRVFMASSDGVLATRALAENGCATVNSGQSVSINGLVGFENGASTTLFAVASDGRIYRWEHMGTGAGTVTETARVGANLRAIHGTSPTNLLAVGAESVSSVNEPRIFRSSPTGNAWTRETLPGSLPTDFFLRSVHMVHGQLAHAVGDKGVVLKGVKGVWSELPRLEPNDTPTNIRDAVSYSDTVIYLVANDKTVYVFDGTTWDDFHTVSWTPIAIDGVSPHELWLAGSQGNVARWSR